MLEPPIANLGVKGIRKAIRETAKWPDGPAIRRAGVSSFGLGGTNAHVVVEQAAGDTAARSIRPAPRFDRRRHWIGESA